MSAETPIYNKSSRKGVENLTPTSATLTWTTNESADTQVEYGMTTAYGKTSPLDTTLATSHSVTLSGLSPNTTYHYRVLNRDGEGNLGRR